MQTDVNANLFAIMQAHNVTLRVVLRESCLRHYLPRKKSWPSILAGGLKNATYLRHGCELGYMLLQQQAYKHQFNLLWIIPKLICHKLPQSHFFDLVLFPSTHKLNCGESYLSTSPETLWSSINCFFHSSSPTSIITTTVTTMTMMLVVSAAETHNQLELKSKCHNFRWREVNDEEGSVMNQKLSHLFFSRISLKPNGVAIIIHIL